MKRLSFSEMRALKEDQLGFMQRVAREQGGVAHLKVLWYDLFVISEPDVIRELLIKHPHQLHRDPFSANVLGRFLGNGILMTEGESWKRQRKLMQPAFHALRIRQYTGTMATYAREMVETWRTGDVRAIDQELTQLTLRIIAKTMYDVDLAEQTAEIGRLMKEILSVGEAQLRMSFVPPKWLPTPMNRRQQRALQEVRTLLLDIIRARRAEGTDHGDLLSMLLSVRDEEGAPMPEQQVLDECITLFVAGHETTAAALTWTWHLLSQHPETASQLHVAVDEELGGAPVAFEDLADLPLLDAVIKESLRLYPPAFSFGRTVLEPITVGEHAFPKGAILMISSYATHRRPDLYAAPEQFRPQRFLNAEEQPDRYTYLPFGVGSRVCLGNMFAMLEAAVILATMLQHVRLEPISDRPVEMDTLITLRPRDPLMMRVHKREERDAAQPARRQPQASVPALAR